MAASSTFQLLATTRRVRAGDEPRQVRADRAYILESIVDPVKLVTEGWDPVMPPYDTLTQQDLDAVLMMLASDQSHFVNGAVIAADDGFAV